MEMIAQSTDKTANQLKRKARKFYVIDYNVGERQQNWEFKNLAALRVGGKPLGSPAGKRGFPAYPEKPHLVIGKKRGHPPRDIERFHSYWIISDRLKELFESIDERAFAFQACDVTSADGSTGPVYWLCDVIRVLEAFDQSTVEEIRSGRKMPAFLGDKTLVFDEYVIGDSHIFRTPYSVNVFCDQKLKEECKKSEIKGIRFVESFYK
jgi:Protein of unknown function (DUF1629)